MSKKPAASTSKKQQRKKTHTATLNATTMNQSITRVYTHGTIKKKRAIVYYYVSIYTTADVSANTAEGDQQLYFYVKAVKPTGKTTLVQFLFFLGKGVQQHTIYIMSMSSSSSNSPSSSAVASWYCWYSETRSFMLDSASVNSISSIPSPVYQ